MRSKVTCKSLLQLVLLYGTILHHFSTCGGNWCKIVPYSYIAEVSYIMGEFYMSKPLNFDVV